MIKPTLAILFSMSLCGAAEIEPPSIKRIVAVENVCAWPNLTMLRDGTIIATIHNKPGHGTMEGDVDCWASADGEKWEKRGNPAPNDPHTVRMNLAAGLARNGDLIVLCSGWTDVPQPPRPKQAKLRDGILRPWVCRSADGGRTWTRSPEFPAAEAGWSEHIPFGDIFVADDGSLRTSTYQGKFADPAKSTKTSGWRSWNLRSDDDGKTWGLVSIIGPKHNETALFHAGGQHWFAAARIDAMEIFSSEDDGKTWTLLSRPTEKNEINGHLQRLKDGRVLLTYGVRIKDQHGVKAKFSSDEGKTWSPPLRIARSNESDCGYPSSVQRADGRIVTAYYSKSAPECDHYHMGVAIWEAPPRQ
jgi:BNR repeat-like domain